MQHYFNFAIELEDEQIAERIARNAEKQITESIEKTVREQLFAYRYDYKTRKNEQDGPLSAFAHDIFVEWLKSHKDEIIDRAADMLAKRLANSKAGKAIIEEVKQ